MFDVGFCCFLSMMRRMEMVPMRDMRMVRGLFMIAGLMVFRCFLMMMSGVLQMFSRFLVMFSSLF